MEEENVVFTDYTGEGEKGLRAEGPYGVQGRGVPGGVQGQRPCSRPAGRRKLAPFENSQNSRNSSYSSKEEDHPCSGKLHGGKGDPFCLLSYNLFVVFCAATSFSTLRKKHTGPRQSKTVAGFASSTQALTTLVAQMRDLTSARGGSRLPSLDSLTFTHHFRLRRSPHWGPVMRKRPLWTPPRLFMVRGA